MEIFSFSLFLDGFDYLAILTFHDQYQSYDVMSQWGNTTVSWDWPRSSRSGHTARQEGDRIMINCEGFQFVKESRWSGVEKGSFQGKAFLFPPRVACRARTGGPGFEKSRGVPREPCR